MNTTVITLAQAAANIEENGQSIKVGSFDTFGAFASYFDIHYRPMLERIQNGDEISDKDRHLFNFLASDLLEAMGADGSEDAPAQPYDLYIDGDCVESFDTLTEARQAYEKAASERPDSVIDILSADGETSYMGMN